MQQPDTMTRARMFEQAENLDVELAGAETPAERVAIQARWLERMYNAGRRSMFVEQARALNAAMSPGCRRN